MKLKQLIFFFSLALVLNAGVCKNDRPLTINVDREGKTLLEFNEPMIYFLDPTKQDGLEIQTVDEKKANKYLIQFKKGIEKDIINLDGKTKEVFKGFKYSESVTDLYFFTVDKKEKCVFLVTPVRKSENPKKIHRFEVKRESKEIDTLKQISSQERKDFDNERDLLLAMNKAIFTDDKNDTFNLYSKHEFNKVVEENEKYKVIYLYRKIGANFVQDVYNIVAKIDIRIDRKKLLSFATLAPNDKRIRVISTEKGKQIKKGMFSTIVIAREN